MTFHAQWSDRLSDLLDDELAGAERQQVEAHVAECAECAALFEELRQVKHAAAALTPAPPPADLWAGIEARIQPSGRRAARRFAFSGVQLLAASVVLALLSAWAALQIIRPPAPAAAQAAPPLAPLAAVDVDLGSAQAADIVPAAMTFDDVAYDRAVQELDDALQRGRNRLDPATIRIVEDNLAAIDRAVLEARQALARDPANGYLSGYFVETRQRKLDLMRTAAQLVEQ